MGNSPENLVGPDDLSERNLIEFDLWSEENDPSTAWFNDDGKSTFHNLDGKHKTFDEIVEEMKPGEHMFVLQEVQMEDKLDFAKEMLGKYNSATQKHWNIDKWYNMRVITNEVHEELHRWVEKQKVGV